MMNILVPTDFTPASLQLAEQAVITLQRPVNIIFFHAFHLPFYHQDLLGTVKRPYHDLITQSFWNQCRQLKQHYPKLINDIRLRCMQGNTQALFNNLLEANDVDMIIYPKNFLFRPVNESSIDPSSFFKRSKCALLQDIKLMPTKISRVSTFRRESVRERI